MTTLQLLRDTIQLLEQLENNLFSLEEHGTLESAKRIRPGLTRRLRKIEKKRAVELGYAEPRCEDCGEELLGETESERGTCADCNGAAR